MKPITHELVDSAGARLSEGGWRYTPRQLYYASCAAAETPHRSNGTTASGVVGLGVLLMLIGLIFIGNRVVFAALVASGIALVLGGLLLRLRREPELGRVLAMSYPDFVREFCAEPRDRMIDVASEREAMTGREARAAVVCDNGETAALVRANKAVAGVPADVAVHTDLDQVPLDADVVVLHDASPAGCALAAEASGRGSQTVDAGLRPRDVMHADLQVLEGAPARVPSIVDSTLLDGEMQWLRSGRRLELAVLPPDAVLDLLLRGIRQLEAKRAPSAAAVD